MVVSRGNQNWVRSRSGKVTEPQGISKLIYETAIKKHKASPETAHFHKGDPEAAMLTD